jgi:ABC-type amino acid transport system permease subunit
MRDVTVRTAALAGMLGGVSAAISVLYGASNSHWSLSEVLKSQLQMTLVVGMVAMFLGFVVGIVVGTPVLIVACHLQIGRMPFILACGAIAGSVSLSYITGGFQPISLPSALGGVVGALSALIAARLSGVSRAL